MGTESETPPQIKEANGSLPSVSPNRASLFWAPPSIPLILCDETWNSRATSAAEWDRWQPDSACFRSILAYVSKKAAPAAGQAVMSGSIDITPDNHSSIGGKPLPDVHGPLTLTDRRNSQGRRPRLVIGSGVEEYTIPLSQGELASLIGATREATSTTLNALARRSLIRLGRRQIILASLDGVRGTLHRGNQMEGP
jgi:Crp-like helix-turn-helix domain